jgi:hypothetical protein
MTPCVHAGESMPLPLTARLLRQERARDSREPCYVAYITGLYVSARASELPSATLYPAFALRVVLKS